ncbi:MAG: MBL fold metallo-hydrolase [Ruminococcaceae bacterium]|nr:MBL fold metallo-hydrolase [Oscillospiraceae bacterium]
MKKFSYTMLLLLLLLLLCLCGCNSTGIPPSNEGNEPESKVEITPAKVDILKVGKADCIVINTGGKIVMIDTGEEENLDRINAYMTRNGYEKVDVLILTHYDKDHIGGASEIITKYGVETVIESSLASNNQWYISYHNALILLKKEPLKLSENYTFTFDSCSFEISIPKKKSYPIKQDNNSSLVVSMKIGENSFLFCADAMELRLAELIEDGVGRYDFVKLPYHGNYLENYREFLDKVTPTYGAITCSNKNPASEDTLNLLQEYGTLVYQTKNGEINVSTDGVKIEIKQ